MQVGPRASAALWAPEDSSLLILMPQLVTQCQEPATTHTSESQAVGLAILLAPGGFLTTEHGGPALSTVPDSKRALAPLSKSKNTRFPTERKKAITCYSAGSTRSPVPQGTQKPSASHCINLQESHVSPVTELESQILHQVAICYSAGARRPVPHSAQIPDAPHFNFRRAIVPPSKSRNSRPLTERRKEVIVTT
jgi:hypothetical protein